MDYKKYWSELSADEKQDLSERCELSRDMMRFVAYGHRQFSVEAAKRVYSETNGKVPLHKLRPDVWAV